MINLRDRRRPLILDGATGTELIRRGYRTELPLWSAGALLEAPDLVTQVHREYVQAGAEVITANTFRTNRRTVGARMKELTKLAVDLARASGAAIVAGSIAPVEDCYAPRLSPGRGALREHEDFAAGLAEAGVDILLIETMNTLAEAEAAVQAAARTGLPVWVSFIFDDDGRLLSGEPVREMAGAEAMLVNCTSLDGTRRALQALRAATRLPIGAYANIMSSNETPALYARAAAEWVALGARIVGGCCGTTPEHIRAVVESVR